MHRHDIFPEEELIGHYRATFSSPAGKVVLQHMLFDLGVLQTIDTEEDKALSNYGNRLLAILAGGEVASSSLEVFTERIVRQQLTKE